MTDDAATETGQRPEPAEEQAAQAPAATRPRRRAIVLVPGLHVARRDQERDLLADSLSKNDLMPVDPPTDGKIAGATFKRLKPTASSTVPDRPEVDVFEAYWTDLSVPQEPPSPLKRFAQATALLGFWFFHPWWMRRSLQSFSLFASIIVTAVLMLLWYATVLAALASFALQTPGSPAAETAAVAVTQQVTSAVGEAGDGSAPTTGRSENLGSDPADGTTPARDSSLEGGPDTAAGTRRQEDAATTLFVFIAEKLQPVFKFIDDLAGTEWFALIVLALAAMNIGKFMDVPRFVRDYLQSGRNGGLDMDVIQRVQDTLDHVYDHVDDAKAPYYDEVVLLGHSMGGVVSLEALAGWGNSNVGARTTLITWGSPLAVLSARSAERIGRMVQEAFAGAVPRWIDVYSHKDWMSGELEGHTQHYPGDTLVPEFTVGWFQGISVAAHNQYYYNRETLSLLLMPRISVDELPDRRGADLAGLDD